MNWIRENKEDEGIMRNPGGSIKTLFIACIVIITGVLLTIQTFINVSQFQESMETQIREKLEQQGQGIAAKLDQRLLQIEQKGEGLSRAVNNMAGYDNTVCSRLPRALSNRISWYSAAAIGLSRMLIRREWNSTVLIRCARAARSS